MVHDRLTFRDLNNGLSKVVQRFKSLAFRLAKVEKICITDFTLVETWSTSPQLTNI